MAHGRSHGAAVAAAVEQTADAPENTSQRDARRKNVGDFPDRKFFPGEITDGR